MKSLFLAAAVVVMLMLMCWVFAGGIKYGQSAPRVATADDKIEVWHDDQRHVTCWIYHAGHKGGLSCIPDQNLRL